ncbi:class II aldolase/adducin family protein [candidate division KSB1 bacterium]|nr:MAG: class II aldolase/adducin family protein [candidate division KSB1 bacterium]
MNNGGEIRAKTELIQTARALHLSGFLPATDGNLSVRKSERRILITASHIEKGNLNEADIVELALDNPDPGRASSEWRMHRAVYLAREEIECILHVHSPYLTAFAAAHRVPRVNLLAEAAMTCGEIVFIPFRIPGTAELAETLIRTSRTASVYLLANHGVVAVGKDVMETRHRLERAEFLAQTEWLCSFLGGGVPIDSETPDIFKV